jgi:two-component system response regulator HydG
MELSDRRDQDEARDRGRVLIVDDSRFVRAVVARHLKNAGFLVQEADTGATAMKILSGGRIDVVITDLRMPELDGGSSAATGEGLTIEVKVLPETPAYDRNSARALRLGAHDYLTRPSPSGDEVILTVDRAVEKKRRLSH